MAGTSNSHTYFNPRSSCEERLQTNSRFNALLIFQSTLLMRGATLSSNLTVLSIPNFNPRSSCEERLRAGTSNQGHLPISIHAPHARSDMVNSSRGKKPCNFNPRSSCEERLPIASKELWRLVFQSTLLMRGATGIQVDYASSKKFQSTLLMRGATRIAVLYYKL